MNSEERPVFDHLKYGKQTRHFVYPPKFDGAGGFEEVLLGVIPIKLKEILERAEFLKEQRDSKLESISGKFSKGSIGEYFYTSLIFHEFSEYFVIQKWIKYWLRLWSEVNPQYKSEALQSSSGSRFTEAQIETARQSPIEEHYEGNLRKSGSRLVGRCPFHEEKTPSFYIFPDNHWYCFGACSEGGDVITFLMKLRNISFYEAVKQLI